MRLLRPPGAKQHSKKHAFCAPRAQNSVSTPPQARILRSPSTKQCLRTTPGAHFALFERKTAPRTHSPGTFRALRARNSPPHPSVADFRVRRREIILIVISNDMRVGNDSSQAASVEFARRRRANYARSGLQSPSKMKGNSFAVPFRFRIYIRLSPPVPSSSRRWGGSSRR